MQYRSGSDIRETFLRFFASKGHRRVHSSSLVPANDPTLLFTNAGMDQFKDVFLGAETAATTTRATTSQKCVRAGGKHNDLENVGFTAPPPHVLRDARQLLASATTSSATRSRTPGSCSPRRNGSASPRTSCTSPSSKGDEGVPRDDEADELWRRSGVPDRPDHPNWATKDNFWQMGDTGPCGPCSEIFYDMGPAASETGEDEPVPARTTRATSRSGTSSSCSSIAIAYGELAPAAQAVDRHRAWAWSAWPPCCRARSRTTRPICLRR